METDIVLRRMQSLKKINNPPSLHLPSFNYYHPNSPTFKLHNPPHSHTVLHKTIPSLQHEALIYPLTRGGFVISRHRGAPFCK